MLSSHILENFKKIVDSRRKVIEALIDNKDMSKFLEQEISFQYYPEMRKSIQWEFDENIIFDNFMDYKNFALNDDPKMDEYLDNLENFINRMDEIVIDLENLFEIGIEEIAGRYPFVKYKRILFEKDIAKKYKYRTEFQKGKNSVYSTAKERGHIYLENICSHMEWKGNFQQKNINRERTQWTNEILSQVASHYNTKFEFKKNEPAAALAAYRRGNKFYESICSHMESRFVWTKDLIEEEAKKYDNRTDFIENSKNAYNAAKRMNILNEVCFHMVITKRKGYPGYWTDDLIREEALKYKKLTDFYKGNQHAYNLSRKRGKKFFDSISSHMVKQNIWTDESIRKEAKKYKSRRLFSMGSASAYQAACRKGIDYVDLVCAHMIISQNQIQRRYVKENFVPKLSSLLDDLGIEYDLKTQFKIPIRDNEPGIIDVLLKLITYDTLIVIKIKHDDTEWTQKSIKKQIAKYNRAFRERKGFEGTYLISPEGRYGFSEIEFFDIIRHLSETKNLDTPNSLEWYRERR